MEIADQCCVSGCELPPKTIAESRTVCLTHFFITSYERLGGLSRTTRTWSHGGAEWEFARRITNECTQSAADIANHPQGLSNLDRARLLDIIHWAGELGRSLRRDARSSLTIPIRLTSERPGRCWEEDTQTVDVSRGGAQTTCERSVENGEVLTLLRIDTQKQTKVRVVWHRRTALNVQQIGVEFIGDEEIWNLNYAGTHGPR